MSTTDTAKKRASFILTYALQSFGLIVVLAILLRLFLFSSYVMSGASMLPSIWPGEFLLGVKWRAADPHRGEVVVLRCPQVKEKLCLKRVVAVAGDRVELKTHGLWINGREVTYKDLGAGLKQEFIEGSSWSIWPGQDKEAKSALVVPPHYVYVLNDKRGDGEDSRAWGALSTDLVEARITRVWLSLDWFERDGTIRSWPRVRWNRMLRSIN